LCQFNLLRLRTSAREEPLGVGRRAGHQLGVTFIKHREFVRPIFEHTQFDQQTTLSHCLVVGNLILNIIEAIERFAEALLAFEGAFLP
jgi:hypothetical protein